MSGTAPSDEVTIIVGDISLSGWQDLSISRGIERFPASFDLALTERYPGEAGQIDIQPGSPCTVLIGDDPVITGYVDRYSATIGARSHQVNILGRSMSEDLVDCSAVISSQQTSNATIISLATLLNNPFGIKVQSPDGDSAVMPQFNVVLTETPYEIVERVARWGAFLVYDDTTGDVIIGKLGDSSMASGFQEGVNVQEASVTFSADQRYTQIIPVFLSAAYALDSVSTVPIIPKAQAVDNTLPARADGSPRYRPLIVVSEQNQNAPNLAAQRAQWEMARRVGRSQAVTIKCDTWRDSSGMLWAPNALAPVSIPSLKLQNVTWLISDVTYRRGNEGTTADVTLMPPSAFIPEPDVLQPFNWQVGQELPGGGAANYAPAPR